MTWKYIPGSFFPGTGNLEKNNTEAVAYSFSECLFADDTTIVGERGELQDGVNRVKEVMNMYEEQNNDHKEEHLPFGREEAEDIRMLGSWMGPEKDTRNRIKRASNVWFKVKTQLKNTTLSKKWQARIVQATVVSALLFDCHTRTWWLRDIKRLQTWLDRSLRYIWSNKTGPPLIQMQREGRNMQDVRNASDIRSLRWQIEKRMLERIGHVFRMKNNHPTKIATLGWMEELEEYAKCPGRKRKTVLSWKKMLREADVDWTDMERITADKKGWRDRIEERMEHLKAWECGGDTTIDHRTQKPE